MIAGDQGSKQDRVQREHPNMYYTETLKTLKKKTMKKKNETDPMNDRPPDAGCSGSGGCDKK